MNKLTKVVKKINDKEVIGKKLDVYINIVDSGICLKIDYIKDGAMFVNNYCIGLIDLKYYKLVYKHKDNWTVFFDYIKRGEI